MYNQAPLKLIIYFIPSYIVRLYRIVEQPYAIDLFNRSLIFAVATMANKRAERGAESTRSTSPATSRSETSSSMFLLLSDRKDYVD